MVRVRKLALAIAAASALSSGMVHALGVGELTLKSSLNQPLVAEIELLDVRDLSSDEVRPLLASQEEFSKAGVDRVHFLTDLTFTPVIKGNGKSVIRITSTKPVREPYLNFLVDVLWPRGRLLREYTLLLDPPLYSVAPPPSAKNFTTPVSAPATQVAAFARAPSAASAAPPGSAVAGAEYRTRSSDTLWRIAEQVRGAGSVNQAMLAIQDLNPDAFIGGNINRMKSAQVLRLPNAQQIARRTQAEALAQVDQQNGEWRQRQVNPTAPTVARQLDATRQSRADLDTAKVQAPDNLKLLAADADSEQSVAGSDSAVADTKALQEQLSINREGLDSARRENDELKARMDDLQGQLDKLQRLMQLKDEQLLKLQAELANPTDQHGQAAAQDMPVQNPVPAESKPQSSGLLGNTMLLGLIGGGTLLGLLALLLLSRRNARSKAPQAGFALPETVHPQSVTVERESSVQPPAAEQVLEAQRFDVDAKAVNRTKDALQEADIYVAYGRFNQAVELLHKAIADAPERIDLRLKLMEVYAELKDADGFARQEHELRHMPGTQNGLDQLRQRYPDLLLPAAVSLQSPTADDELDSSALDDLMLDDLLLDEPLAPVNQQAPVDIVDFDLLSLDEEPGRESQPLDPFQPQAAPSEDLRLGLADSASDVSEPVAELAEFEFDLDLREEAVPAVQEDEFLLTLEDEPESPVDVATVSAAHAEMAVDDPLDLSSDFDLSLENDASSPEPQALSGDFAAQLDEVVAQLDQLVNSVEQPLAADAVSPESVVFDDVDDFDFLADTDETATKLDLARAYIDMGDTEGARDILDEVIAEGNHAQQQEARELISQLV
jgi:pilus assembly protein FimV